MAANRKCLREEEAGARQTAGRASHATLHVSRTLRFMKRLSAEVLQRAKLHVARGRENRIKQSAQGIVVVGRY